MATIALDRLYITERALEPLVDALLLASQRITNKRGLKVCTRSGRLADDWDKAAKREAFRAVAGLIFRDGDPSYDLILGETDVPEDRISFE